MISINIKHLFTHMVLSGAVFWERLITFPLWVKQLCKQILLLQCEKLSLWFLKWDKWAVDDLTKVIELWRRNRLKKGKRWRKMLIWVLGAHRASHLQCLVGSSKESLGDKRGTAFLRKLLFHHVSVREVMYTTNRFWWERKIKGWEWRPQW